MSAAMVEPRVGPVSETVVARPAPVLRPYVGHYVGYRLLGHQAGIHRGLPSRHLTFIVSIGPTIDVVQQTDPRQAPDRYGFVLSGLQASTALISHDGNQEGVVIELTPLGSRALFGMPSRAIWNTSLEAADVVGPVAHQLRERLHLTADWAERFAACDDVLGRLLQQQMAVVPEVRRAWQLLVASRGRVPIAEVAADVGWSRRHLTHRFRHEFGLSPKLAARVVRFERARYLVQSPARPGLAQVAAECGYYDQPHLNRDFVELAGCSPLQWLEDEGLPLCFDDELLAHA